MVTAKDCRCGFSEILSQFGRRHSLGSLYDCSSNRLVLAVSLVMIRGIYGSVTVISIKPHEFRSIEQFRNINRIHPPRKFLLES